MNSATRTILGAGRSGHRSGNAHGSPARAAMLPGDDDAGGRHTADTNVTQGLAATCSGRQRHIVLGVLIRVGVRRFDFPALRTCLLRRLRNANDHLREIRSDRVGAHLQR